MIPREICLLNLKQNLYNEIGLHDKLNKDLEYRLNKLDLLQESISLLETDNIIEIFENCMLLSCLLEPIYGSVTAEQKANKIRNIIGPIISHQHTITIEYLVPEVLKKIDVQKNLLINDFETEKTSYNIDTEKFKNDDKKIKEYRKIQSALKFKIPISKRQSELISEYLKSIGINDARYQLTMEALRIHNSSCKSNKNPKNYHSIIEKMLTLKLYYFQISEEEELAFNKSYANMALSFYRTIDKTDVELLDDLLESLPKKEDGYALKEIKYIYKVIFNSLIKEIRESIDLVKDTDNYDDSSTRNVAMAMFQDYYNKYTKIYFFCKNEMAKYNDTLEEVETSSAVEKTEVELPDVNKIIYLQNNNGDSLMEKDLKTFPNEYYETVKDLLISLKKGMLHPGIIESFTGANKKLSPFTKLKEDQVRILYRHVEGDYYLVLGGFVKKDNQDLTNYYKLAARDINLKPDTLEKLYLESKELEVSLFNSIDQNKRKKYR